MVGAGEIVNGKLFIFGRHPAGTYILEGEGISETGNIKYEFNETIVVTGDVNLGTVICKSYIPSFQKMYLNFVDSQTDEILRLDEIFGLNFVFDLYLYHNNGFVDDGEKEYIAEDIKTVAYDGFNYYQEGQYSFSLYARDGFSDYDITLNNVLLSRNSTDGYNTIVYKDGAVYITIGLDKIVTE